MNLKHGGKTERHLIVIYADFEALIVKNHENIGSNTIIINKHTPMSFGLLVKTIDNIPVELLEEFEIPQEAIVYRGSETEEAVAKHFI